MTVNQLKNELEDLYVITTDILCIIEEFLNSDDTITREVVISSLKDLETRISSGDVITIENSCSVLTVETYRDFLSYIFGEHILT